MRAWTPSLPHARRTVVRGPACTSAFSTRLRIARPMASRSPRTRAGRASATSRQPRARASCSNSCATSLTTVSRSTDCVASGAPPSARASASSRSARRASRVSACTSVSRALAHGRGIRHAGEELRLRERAGDRRAQLVGAVVGEGPFGFERLGEAGEQPIRRFHRRSHFRDDSGERQEAQGPRILLRNGARRALHLLDQRAGCAEHDERDEREERRKGHHQPQHRRHQFLVALADRIGHVQEALAHGIDERRYPPRAGIGEALAQRNVQQLRAGVVRLEQDRSGRVADHERVARPRAALVGLGKAAPENRRREHEVVGGGGEGHQDRAAFLELVIGAAIDEALEHEAAADHPCEPQQRHPREQAAREPAGDRSRCTQVHPAACAGAASAVPHW